MSDYQPLSATTTGSFAWLEKRNGQLSLLERAGFIAQGVWAQSKARFLGKARFRSSAKVDHARLQQIRVPETQLVMAAHQLCAEASSLALVNHAYRSYSFSQMLDPLASRQNVDEEALIIAFLFHDLGLTDRYRLGEHDPQQCFTYPAAKMAFEFARSHRQSDRWAYRIADAIAMHLNVTVGAQCSREAQLLRLGSGADAAGIGIGAEDQDWIKAVVSRYPRVGLGAELKQSLRVEMRQRPGSRAGFFCAHLGFLTMASGVEKWLVGLESR